MEPQEAEDLQDHADHVREGLNEPTMLCAECGEPIDEDAEKWEGDYVCFDCYMQVSN